MAACGLKCDKCKIKDFCGYSVDTLGYDSFVELVENHDKEIVMNTIDECIKDLKGSYPLIDNFDRQHGFWCAIQRLEQIKEEKGDNNE